MIQDQIEEIDLGSDRIRLSRHVGRGRLGQVDI
jgi:hypothetical protein